MAPITDLEEEGPLLRARCYAGPIVIGSGQLSDEVNQYVQADHWSNDAVTGVALCKRLVEEAQ